MPRPSPFNRRHPATPLKRETRSFQLDPEDPSTAFTMTLQELDILAEGVAVDKQREYVTRYLKGVGGKAPERLILPDRSFVPVSRDLLCCIANLEAMERPEKGDAWPEGEEPANLHWWLGVAKHAPDVWEAVQAWTEKFPFPYQRRLLGNLQRAASREAAGTPSEPSSD